MASHPTPADGSLTPPDGGITRRQLHKAALTGALAAIVLPATGGTALASGRRQSPAQAATLTPQQLAGQRVIYSYPGLTPPQSLFNDIQAGQAAGVIFFGENISSTSQIAGVVGQLRQAQAQSPIPQPLLLMRLTVLPPLLPLLRPLPLASPVPRSRP